jgi:hypothetical protein
VAMTPGVLLDMLPLEWAGGAEGICKAPLVTHDSAHDQVGRASDRFWVRVKAAKRQALGTMLGRPYHEWKYGNTRSDRWAISNG